MFVADTGNNPIQKIQIGQDTEPNEPGPRPSSPPKPSKSDSSSERGNHGRSSKPNVPVKITKVKLIPHMGWIYADGYLDMRVQVTNKGNQIAYKTDVYLTSSRKKVKVRKRIRIHQILPGWTVTKTFKVRAKRNARGWVMIQADTSGRRNRSFLRIIKPWW